MAQPHHIAVTLRRLQRSDAEAITRLLENDPEGISWTARIPYPYTLADAHAMLDSSLGAPDSNAIEVNGEFGGGIGLHPSDSDPKTVEIGYWVGKPFRGQGIASRAVDLILDRAREQRLHGIDAIVFPGNEPSIRLLTTRGFRQTHESDMNIPLRGGLRRVLHFRLDLLR